MTTFRELLFLVCFISISSALRIVPTQKSRVQDLKFRKLCIRKTGPAVNTILKPACDLHFKTHPSSLSPIYSDLSNGDLIGEDAATFNLSEQSLKDWGTFLVAVGGILSFLFYVWIYDGGPVLGNQFKDLMESLAGGDTTLTITYMLGFFAVAHSGLASLRPAAEKIIG